MPFQSKANTCITVPPLSNCKRKLSTWHMDEAFVRIAGALMYSFRAVDSQGQTVDF